MTLYQNLDTMRIVREEIRLIDTDDHVQTLVREVEKYSGQFDSARHGSPSDGTLDDYMGTLELNASRLTKTLGTLVAVINSKRSNKNRN